MKRFKELEEKLKKTLRPNVPTNSDDSKYLRMVRAKEGDKEKLIYYGKKSLGQSIEDQYANFGLMCDRPMSKLTKEYWICRDLLGRKQRGVDKLENKKEEYIEKKKDIR